MSRWFVGFVEHEEVRCIEEDLREREPGALTTERTRIGFS